MSRRPSRVSRLSLLELAMVLFLVGIIVLLWTLDSIVAIVVTVFIALFLSVVVAFTVLPVIHKRCPYKSPTAWACVAAYDLLVSRPVKYARRVRSYYEEQRHRGFRWRETLRAIPNDVDWPTRDVNWRARDLDVAREPMISGTSLATLQKAAAEELWSEANYPIIDGRVRVRETLSCLYTPAHPAVHALLLSISEASHLFNALLQVSVSSQDTRVLDHVNQCLGSIYPELKPTDVPVDREQTRTMTCWCIFLAIWRYHELKTPHAVLLGPPTPQGSPSEGLNTTYHAITTPDVTTLRQNLHLQCSDSAAYDPAPMRVPFTTIISRYMVPPATRSLLFRLLLTLLAQMAVSIRDDDLGLQEPYMFLRIHDRLYEMAGE